MSLRFERFFGILAILGALFLAFMAGAVLTYYHLPPYGWIRDAVTARNALEEKQERIDAHTPPATPDLPMEIIHKQGAYEGYTLFTSRQHAGAWLVDMDGNKIHEWNKTFSQVWKDRHPQVKSPLPDAEIYWRDAHLYPNGDLLVIYEVNGGDTPYGYGLAKLDKDSNVLWHFDSNVHHRISIGKDGTIYALTQQFVRMLLGDRPEEETLLSDYAVMISPEGRELKRVSIYDALMNSDFRYVAESYKRERNPKGDMFHTNSIEPLEAEMASAFPMLKPGQALLSMARPGAIGVLDFEEEKFVWATYGPWKRQHHATFQPDGTIMVFDNRGLGNQRSRIIAYHPADKKITTVYQGAQDNSFFSAVRGMQQVLPNGNLLISESDKGRLFEITPEHEIVWQMMNPFAVSGERVEVAIAYRFAPGELTFLNKAP